MDNEYIRGIAQVGRFGDKTREERMGCTNIISHEIKLDQ